MAKEILFTTITYSDKKGQFLQGSVNAKLLKTVKNMFMHNVGDEVEYESAKAIAPKMAIPPFILGRLKQISEDKELKKRSEELLNISLKSAVAEKFRSGGFGKWKKLSKNTTRRKTKNKYNPLLNTRAMKNNVKKYWNIRNFGFATPVYDTKNLQDFDLNSLIPLSFDISFGSKIPKLKYKNKTKLKNYAELLGVHTNGISGRLPKRQVLINYREFQSHVWKKFMAGFEDLLKYKVKKRLRGPVKTLTPITMAKAVEQLKNFVKSGLLKPDIFKKIESAAGKLKGRAGWDWGYMQDQIRIGLFKALKEDPSIYEWVEDEVLSCVRDKSQLKGWGELDDKAKIHIGLKQSNLEGED